MSGILFLRTQRLDSLREFYTRIIGCELWQDQGDCQIFRHGNFLFGFCERDEVQSDAMLTFFFDSRDEVDHMYTRLRDLAVSEPVENARYNIYQFFAKDPEGRMVEIQYFNDPVASFRTGDDLMLTRRSVRRFESEPVSDELLDKVIELSRWAPTSRNTESYYFKFIRDRKTIDWLSTTRDKSTGPIGRAPMAVAICSDPSLSKRHIQDGCIGAYHFILATWFYGLGTCWIAAMDREDVKQRLNIPQDHYVVTVTPLGHPSDRQQKVPERKAAEEYIR